ncbi:MAG: hypothetical protein ACJ766_06930 [Thermoleophilaceae bacterium]
MRYNNTNVRALLLKLVLPSVLLAALLPSAAAAKDEPGVHVDPGSPSGKEYAIPLEGARRDASGGGSSSGSSGGSSGSSGGGAAKAPLFGEGITPAGGSQSGGGSGNGSGGSAHKGGKKASAVEQTARSTLASAPAAGSGDSTAQTGAIGLAVLLLGGALGLLLRRGLRS